jgi:hypothetical protein
MESDKVDLELLKVLPIECWAHIISFLPRITRKSLAELNGFKELVEGEWNPRETAEIQRILHRHKSVGESTALLGSQERKSHLEKSVGATSHATSSTTWNHQLP